MATEFLYFVLNKVHVHGGWGVDKVTRCNSTTESEQSAESSINTFFGFCLMFVSLIHSFFILTTHATQQTKKQSFYICCS